MVSLALRAIHLQVPRRGTEGVFPLSVTPEGRDSSPRGGAKLSKVDKHICNYELLRHSSLAVTVNIGARIMPPNPQRR